MKLISVLYLYIFFYSRRSVNGFIIVNIAIIIAVAKEWRRREIVQSAVTNLNKYPSVLNFIIGRKLSKAVVKVFVSKNDKKAEMFLETNRDIPDGTVFEFVNVTERSKEGNKRIQELVKQAPAIDRPTREHLCKLITENGTGIYAKYSNVISIGMSPVLSDGTNTPCITLYCLDKYLIPYGEKPLPDSIQGYPCDIREDYVQLGCGHNCDVLDLGCSIGLPSELSAGSAGFLVKSNDQIASPKIGFLTAAHVAVSEFEELYRKKERLSECVLLGYPYDVVHPSRLDSWNSKIVGNVVESFCGNRESVGMDAAFVKLNQPRFKGKQY